MIRCRSSLPVSRQVYDPFYGASPTLSSSSVLNVHFALSVIGQAIKSLVAALRLTLETQLIECEEKHMGAAMRVTRKVAGSLVALLLVAGCTTRSEPNSPPGTSSSDARPTATVPPAGTPTPVPLPTPQASFAA